MVTTKAKMVSVVIPCYNQGRYLSEAIDSVFAQTHPHYEVLLVDDGSTDETPTVARRYAAVRYLPQSNQGLPAARNAGLRAAKGSHVVFLDADDRLLPNHFATSLAAFEEQPDASMVFGATSLFGAVSRHQHLCNGRNTDMYEQLLKANVVHAPHAAMYKGSVLSELGSFSTAPDIKAAEDYELYLRIARQRQVYCHHHTVGEYRCHSEQMSKKYQLMLESNVRVLQMQLPYVHTSRLYGEAYRAGIRRAQRAYGEPLAWQIMPALRRGDWRSATAALRSLLRHYPAGLLIPVQHKLRRNGRLERFTR